MVKMSLKKTDSTVEMVTSIYSKPVPSQSELSNPFAANKRRKKTTLVEKNDKTLPDSIENWSSKNFVDYFAEEYYKIFKGKYKITYVSDNKLINEIFDFMEENQLPKQMWTKKFIDWCFLNNSVLLQSVGSFLLMNLRKFLNKFYQDVVLTSANISLIDIFNEVKDMDDKGRSKEILAKYGIPIAATYFIHQKDISYDNVVAGLSKLFAKFESGTDEEKKILSDIFQKSISRSPYIPEFALLNWRDLFFLAKKFSKESWWREEDYPGEPRFKYDKFLK
jgi:hypothetical protein